MLEYGVIASFSCLIYLLADQSWRRIQILTGENDKLREKIQLLSGQLQKDNAYQDQLRYLSQLEERNRIAQNIHDKIGHTISGSLIQLEAAALYIDNDSAKAKRIIEKVIPLLREGIDHIRITLKNIKPATEQLGINRIKLMLDEFTATNRVQPKLLYHGDLERISQLQWRIIHDNLSEALTNVLKYAQASTVTVNIEVLDKFIKAEVKDDGIGAYHIKKGIGLSGMEERSGNLGGKLVIDGSRGFSIITLLPLEGE